MTRWSGWPPGWSCASTLSAGWDRERKRRSPGPREVRSSRVEETDGVSVDAVLRHEWRGGSGDRDVHVDRRPKRIARLDDVEEGERLHRIRHPARRGLFGVGDFGRAHAAERRKIDVGVADRAVTASPQRAAEVAGEGREEVRLLVVRLVVTREIDALPSEGPESPDNSLDVATGAREDARRRRGKLRAGGVRDQVFQVWLVRVRHVEEIRARDATEQGGHRSRGEDRSSPQSVRHGQNPAVIEK